jgi:hypothetical protein
VLRSVYRDKVVGVFVRFSCTLGVGLRLLVPTLTIAFDRYWFSGCGIVFIDFKSIDAFVKRWY